MGGFERDVGANLLQPESVEPQGELRRLGDEKSLHIEAGSGLFLSVARVVNQACNAGGADSRPAVRGWPNCVRGGWGNAVSYVDIGNRTINHEAYLHPAAAETPDLHNAGTPSRQD